MTRVRVLIVDDEPLIGAALEAWLRRSGFEVVFARGPEAADAALLAGHFDVVLSDVQMPGNYKLEWIARRLGEDCPPPILLMTGNPELETAMRAANLPVAGYLLKPLFYAEASALIERLAADYRRRRSLLDLAQEVGQLVASAEPAAPAAPAAPLTDELHRLARHLAAEARHTPRRDVADDHTAPWRNAITDTIGVLEKTKHSFKSKELGQLRRRLQSLLPDKAPAGPPAEKKVSDFPKVAVAAAD